MKPTQGKRDESMRYKRYKRILVIVIDSIGVGDAPDAAAFNSEGADTLGHMASWWIENQGRALKLPHMARLGLNNTRPDRPFAGIPTPDMPTGAFGRMQVTSLGTDSLDGHWEMVCLPTRFHMDYFPQGFPESVIGKIEEFSGRGVICNMPYSGTQAIYDYGERQMQTGELIIYTSSDSVMQIAAHEDVIPVDELYRICSYARSLLNGPEITMGRVIARPYIGPDKEHFTRTARRHDFGLTPVGPTVLDFLHEAGYNTIAVGKTYDLLCGHGFEEHYRNKSNSDGMDHVDHVMTQDWCGLCFANLVDFDTLYGHRRDPLGDGLALEDFDRRLGHVLEGMRDDDLIIVTADHGTDPTYRGTDHTRELVPLLVWSPSLNPGGCDLGLRSTCCDLGATVLDNFNVPGNGEGTSFLPRLLDVSKSRQV